MAASLLFTAFHGDATAPELAKSQDVRVSGGPAGLICITIVPSAARRRFGAYRAHSPAPFGRGLCGCSHRWPSPHLWAVHGAPGTLLHPWENWGSVGAGRESFVPSSTLEVLRSGSPLLLLQLH